MKTTLEINTQIGENIRKARNEKDILLRHMASSLGISEAQASKYENGKNAISAGLLIKISYTLGVKPEQLLKGTL